MTDATNGAADGRPRRPSPAPPPGVADRLEILRSLHVAQALDPAARSAEGTGHPVSKAALAILFAARLRELRALDELARYLHRGQVAGRKPAAMGP